MPPATARRQKADPADPMVPLSNIVHGEFARSLGTEHERQVRVFVETTAIAVTDAPSFERVAGNLRDLAGRRKTIVEFFKQIKTLANQLHKAICEREHVLLDPLDALDKKARQNLLAYAQEEDRVRRAEEQRLAEEAQKRRQDELANEAAALERRGETALAQSVLEQAVSEPAPTIVLESSTPRVAGVSVRENWTWEFKVDEATAVKHLAKTNPELLSVDRKKMNAYAEAHKASGRLPGIRIYDAGGLTVKA